MPSVRATRLSGAVEDVRTDMNHEDLVHALYNILSGSADADALQEQILDLVSYEAIDRAAEILQARQALVEDFEQVMLGLDAPLDAAPDEGGPPGAAGSTTGSTACSGVSDAGDEEEESPYEQIIRFVQESAGVPRTKALSLLNKAGWDVESALLAYLSHREAMLYREDDAPSEDQWSREVHEPGTLPDGIVVSDASYLRQQKESDRRSTTIYTMQNARFQKTLGMRTVDLHGLKACDAVTLVREAVNGLLDRLNAREDRKNCSFLLRVITGRGKHSQGRPVIRELVQSLFSQNAVKFCFVNGTRNGAVEALLTSETSYL